MSGGGVARVRPVLSAVAVLGAVVAHLALQAGVMLSWPGWTWSSFRTYYSFDQLSYLAIAADAAHGRSAFAEPFTLTGSDYYPRAYYVLLGHLAQVASVHPAATWTACGLLVQAVTVGVIGTVAVVLTRRWWAGLLGFVPFVLGTGSWLLGGGWRTQLDSHAVLWGPFGVVFPLNGETVALSMGCWAALALLVVAAGRLAGRGAFVAAVAAALLVGLSANVQTYGFLTGLYVVVAGCAAYGLVRSRSRVRLLLTAALAAVVVAVGPVVAQHLSPLATLAAGLLPALPGLAVVARLVPRAFAICCVALAAGASPQIVATVVGLAGGDAFLTYRQRSSVSLGVPWTAGLYAGAPAVLALALVAVLGARRRQATWVAASAALAFSWLALGGNDVWGANQEPYRLWLDSYVMVAAIGVPLTAWALVEVLRGGAAEGVPMAAVDARPPAAAPPRRVPVVAALAVVLAVTLAWSADFVVFRRAAGVWGAIPMESPLYRAAAGLAERTDGSLVLTDVCVDPRLLKAIWGGPVVYYNAGLAWPADKADIDMALDARGTPSMFEQQGALRAGIGYLLVEAGCRIDLTPSVKADLVARRQFTGDPGKVPNGTLELYRLRVAGP